MNELIQELIALLLKAGIKALVEVTEEDEHVSLSFNDHKDEPTVINIRKTWQ